MRKYILLAIFCFGILNLSFAEDVIEEEGDTELEEVSWWDEENEDKDKDSDKDSLRIKDRTFEIGFSAFVGLDNDFISAKQVLQEHVVIDLDELKEGFRFNFNMMVSPFFFNFNYRDKWGFGLSTALQATGSVSLSGNMITLSQAEDEKSEVAGAAFLEVGAPVFFHINKLKVKVRPSVFYPLLYVDKEKSDISYTYKTVGEDQTQADVAYKMRVYTAMSLEDTDADIVPTASPGVDLNIGAEFPLSKVLGISNALPFLDFDVGVDFINIPVVPGALKDYMELAGNIGTGGPVNVFDPDFDMENLVETEDTIYGADGGIKVVRPFKFLAHIDWRPLGGSKLLTIIPVIGFAINPLYIEPFSMETVLKGRLDFFNILKLTVGTGFEDRLWKNSVDVALNLRAFEINLGVDMRSTDYAKSLQGAGLGVSTGFKFGW